MLRYLFQRLLQMIPLLLGISFIAFGVISLAPGDFLTQMESDPTISKETISKMRVQFGLAKMRIDKAGKAVLDEQGKPIYDKQPFYIQYFLWLKQVVFHLNFGESFSRKMPVFTLIKQRLFNTMILSFCAMMFIWLTSIPIGIYCAVNRYSLADRIFSLVSYFGVAIPSFFFALVMMFVAFKSNGIFPIGGMTDKDFSSFTFLQKVGDVGRHLILPTFVMGTIGMASLMRQMRANLLDILKAEYVTTARAKGLAERVVIYKHAVRNAINPLVTIFGFQLGYLFSGSLMVEIVMSWPGLGVLMYDALLSKDIYLVMGSLFMSSVMLQLGNLMADVLLVLVDPRIKYD